MMTSRISCSLVLKQNKRWWQGNQFQLKFRRPLDIQVDVGVREAFDSPDGDKSSVVVHVHADTQVVGEDDVVGRKDEQLTLSHQLSSQSQAIQTQE